MYKLAMHLSTLIVLVKRFNAAQRPTEFRCRSAFWLDAFNQMCSCSALEVGGFHPALEHIPISIALGRVEDKKKPERISNSDFSSKTKRLFSGVHLIFLHDTNQKHKASGVFKVDRKIK